MAAITKADVIAIAPEMSALTDATWTIFIAASLARMNPAIWGTKLNFGQSILCAHMLKSIGFGDAVYDNTGKMTSGNKTPQTDSEDLDSTVYGRSFKALRAEVSVAAGGLIWTGTEA